MTFLKFWESKEKFKNEIIVLIFFFQVLVIGWFLKNSANWNGFMVELYISQVSIKI